MGNKSHFTHEIIIILLFFIQKCICNNNENVFESKFTIDIYGEDYIFNNRYNLEFNGTTKLFNEYSTLQELTEVKAIVICSTEDIDKSDEEKETILFWTTSSVSDTNILNSIYISAFPIWYNEQRKKQENKSFCFKIDGVGWDQNANAPICDDNLNHPCPDLIILGTTQLAYRYYRDETLNLEKYFKKYHRNTGKSIENMIYKYSLYDYNIDNNWLAVPIIIDVRTFRFNTTTFDTCYKKGYDLHYPPPLSNYWGKNYHETWTWEKAIEYAGMIKNCTNEPGFRLSGIRAEDIKFFSILCHALGIPFIVDDTEYEKKKCGFNSEEYIEKLSIIRDLFENHYIMDIYDETSIKNWQENDYPLRVEDQPILVYNKKMYTKEDFIINGMILDTLDDIEVEPDIKFSYIPGTSTFLGGSGIIITKKSRFPDELFEYIEVLINPEYPYISELNISVTPYENVYGKKCKNIKIKNPKEDKEYFCNSLLSSNATIPYYYMDSKNNTYILQFTQTTIKNKRGMYIDSKRTYNSPLINIFRNKVFVCANEANFEENTITYHDKYKLEVPVNNNKSVILKSMEDVDEVVHEQTDEMICSIYDELLKKARPEQYPYRTFPEINDFETKAPISILFAHLYHKHNVSEEGKFEDIVDECCRIIDNSFLPDCYGYKKISLELEECDEQNQEMKIIYNNCKQIIGDVPESIECFYIPFSNYKGMSIVFFITLACAVEIFFLVVIIKKKREKCIIMAGYKFLLSIIISGIILNISVIFWIGKLYKLKCIIKIWLIIIGITGLVCAYSIKLEIIISVYSNVSISKTNNRYKYYIIYSIASSVQLILLIVWSFTQEGIIKKRRYIESIDHYDYDTCSIGNENLLTAIFGIDFGLLLLSIVMAFRGKDIPVDYNDSNKILISSLISIFTLILCYLIVIFDMSSFPYTIIFCIIVGSSIAIDLLFIGPKLLVILNIEIDTAISVAMVSSKRTNMTNMTNVSGSERSMRMTNISGSESLKIPNI